MLATEASNRCSTCGNPLEPGRQCNVCLLQLGLSQSDGSSSPPASTMPTIDELNAQFPNLEISRLVGRGGMGAIYHARQTSLDRDVALKLIAKEVSSDPAFVERFEREAKTLAKLSHPNIVTIFDYGHTADGIAYLILEYVDGINLREAISSGSVDSDEALEIVSTICNALEYAHSKGVVHRDIKPENILLGEDGTLKVADFGIAKILDDSVPTPTLTATRQVLGSLHYLAPEHLEAPDQVDHRVDLYAVGVIFYELLTGQLPLGRYEAPSKVSRRVDQRLDGIVLKTLNRRPQQRYQSAAELDSDIEDIATSVKNEPAPQPSPSEPAAGAAVEPDSDKIISVPFTTETMEGLAEVIGVVGSRNGCLYAEFRVRDAIFGQVKSKTHVIEIPKRHLTRVELVRGVLGAKLVITTDTISALGEFPNAETGRTALKIKRVDESGAREIAHALGFDSMQTVERQNKSGPLRWPNEPEDSERQLFGLLMILCGVLNGAVIAVGAYLLVGLLNNWANAFVLVWSIMLGALAILQFVGGIISLVGPSRSLGLFTSFASMVPITPLWLVSCPAGIWLYRRSRETGPQPTLARQPSPVAPRGVGATTIMLLRESRIARLTSVCGTLAAVALMAGLVAVRGGFYPATLQYRIVDTDADGAELLKAIYGRLEGSDGFRRIHYSHTVQPNQLSLSIWQRHGDEIDDMVSVQEIPNVVWLRGVDDTDATPSGNRNAIPVVNGLNTDAFLTGESKLGTTLKTAGDEFPLKSKWVSEITSSVAEDVPSLTIELTAEGRSQLADMAGGDGAGLAIVVDGLIEGIATLDLISQKRIRFQLSNSSEVTNIGIAAGIRGPSLPSPLERLK